MMECRNNRGNGSYVSGPQVGIFSPKSSNLSPFFSIKFSITQADVTDLEWAEFSLEEWIMQVGAGGVVLIPAHPMHTRMTLWWDQHMSSLEFAYICRYLPSPPVKTGDGMSLCSSSLSLHVSRACTQGRDGPVPAGRVGVYRMA